MSGLCHLFYDELNFLSFHYEDLIFITHLSWINVSIKPIKSENYDYLIIDVCFYFQSFTIFQDEPRSNTTSNKHASGRPNNFNDENQPPAGQKHSTKFPPPPPIPIATSSPGEFWFFSHIYYTSYSFYRGFLMPTFSYNLLFFEYSKGNDISQNFYQLLNKTVTFV